MIGLFLAIDRLDAERTKESFESLLNLTVAHFEEEEKLDLPPKHKVTPASESPCHS